MAPSCTVSLLSSLPASPPLTPPPARSLGLVSRLHLALRLLHLSLSPTSPPPRKRARAHRSRDLPLVPLAFDRQNLTAATATRPAIGASHQASLRVHTAKCEMSVTSCGGAFWRDTPLIA